MSSSSTLSLPSIHEMFPDHLMKSNFRRSRTNSRSPEYRSSPGPSTHSNKSLASLHNSAEPTSKVLSKDDHSRHYSESGPPFKNIPTHDSGSKPVAEFSMYAQSGSSTTPCSNPCCSRPQGEPPFDVDSRNHGHSPHLRDPNYSARSILSSDRAHPHPSNRYPYYTNGGNSLAPDYNYEVDDRQVGKSIGSMGGPFLMDGLGRKHVCPTCFKRFNRPSSLRIHLNTHTGATPFKCPWPKCGREFNVNSNMRRHYRNHLGTSRGQGHFPSTHRNELRPLAPAPHPYSEGFHQSTNDHPQFMIRQRRSQEDVQIAPSSGVDIEFPRMRLGQHYGLNYSREDSIPDPDYQFQHKYAPMPSPPSSHSSFSDEELNIEESAPVSSSSRFHVRRSPIEDTNTDMGRVQYRDTPSYSASSHESVSPSPSISRTSSIASRTSSPTGTEVRCPEHTSQPKYNPSKPYSSSLSDARVRTTLRPAFT